MQNTPSIVAVAAALLSADVSGAEEAARRVAANRLIELTFESSLKLADPWGEMELDVVFADPQGREFRVPAFWAGGQTWRVRYSSPEIGIHSYHTVGSRPEDSGLHDQRGSVEVLPYRGDNPLYLHGPIGVSSDRRHFEHADGTPFLWLADTWWMGLCERLRWPQEFQSLARDRREKGFNVIQIVAGLYPDMPAFDRRGSNEAGQPWEAEYTGIRPSYFDAADQRLMHLVDAGLTPCIVGSWGFHLNWLGVDKMKQHWRYLIARYGALPVVWVAAGEGTMPYYLSGSDEKDEEFQKQGWTDILRYIRETDPFHRLLTIHPRNSARQTVSDPQVLDFDMLQTGHGGRQSIRHTIRTVRSSRAAWPSMPTLNGEVCYEGILDSCYDDIQRFMAYSCLLSGAAGHSYGANGIWQVNRENAPYGPSPHGGNWGNRPWNEAMHLPGSQQVGFAAELLRKYPFEQFEPHPEWAAYVDEASREFRWKDWIWFPEGNPQEDAPTARRYFRKVFELPPGEVAQGILRLAPDEDAVAFLNGRRAGRQHGVNNVLPISIPAEWLRRGRNVLAVEVQNSVTKQETNPAGLLCTLEIEFSGGGTTTVCSDASWRSAQNRSPGWTEVTFSDDAWRPVAAFAKHGAPPWGLLRARSEFAEPYTAGIPDHVRVTYFPTSEPAIVRQLETGLFYNASYFDPQTGQTTELGTVVPDTQGEWKPPLPPKRGQDWVLVLKRSRDIETRVPISIHPDNPKYFLFRSKPLALITATEHYGAVVNSAFDFEAYLHDLADKKQTMTRTFLLFREQQTERNPHSPIKPESTEYLTPYLRTSYGQAKDGEPLYDLDRWNHQFFDRLHRFLSQASELGIVVELTLFSNVYSDNVWSLNPLHHKNNIQEMESVEWYDYITSRNAPLLMRQRAYVEKIVQETCRYDNVYYEICNEAGGDYEGGPSCAQVDAWLEEMARVARAELDRLGHRHLIAGSQAFDYSRGYRQGLDHALAAPWVQVMNFHSFPKIDVDGETWKMGGFMTKDLLLPEIAGLCRALQRHPKPSAFDEDNVVNLYENETGWTIQRKRAWATVMGQVHYDFIDFSVTVGHETGTIESQRHIRTWMKHLSEFFHSLDFIRAIPIQNWLVDKPPHLFASVLAVPGSDYVAYLADEREFGDVGAGQPIPGDIAFHLPKGDYQVRLYSPVTGLYSPALRVSGGSERIEFALADFRHDVVLRVTRVDDDGAP